MRNDADYHVRSPRGGKFSSLPSSFRTISNYLRSVSANASSIAASTVRQAAVSAASSGAFNHEDDRQREQVQWSNFDKLELSSGEIRRMLLLTYANGFQVWDVQDASNVHEVVSRRDGPVAFLRLQPRPILQEAVEGGASFKEARPLLLVVTSETGGSGSPGGYGGGGGGGGGGASVGGSQLVATVVKFYSLRNHSYVHTLRFRTGIHAVRCSSRVIAVALATQIYCFDAGTLQNIFSVLTYPSAAPGPGSSQHGFGAMAVGPRWLAYPANQALVATTGRVAPQHLSPSPGVSPSSSPANGSFVAHYAKESSKHIVAGVVTLGDMVYKTTKSYCSELMPDGGSGSPAVGSPSWKNGGNGHSAWQGGSAPEPEFAGTVIIRDIVSKGVVAQFRAHTSPLSALAFDPSGTLLVTASVYGHNLNVFRVTPASSTSGGSGAGESGTSHVHLYKLARGVTNAVIQDVSFSADSHWIAVSSSRGTNHLFAVSPFGGMVGPQTHGTVPIDGLIGPTLTPAPVFPWWSSTGSLSVNQQAANSAPSAITLNVVSRIKNGNGGWRGTVTSAAVTATGRPNAAAGAVAAVFHDGGGAGVESEAGVGTLKDQLWVMCPTGHLVRYLLRPSAGGEGGYTNGLPQMAGMGSPGSPGVGQELKVAVEPMERWDVARRPNWVEREERVEALGAAEEEAAGAQASAGTWAGAAAREGTTTEEMQRWFMSNAEVQMHQARPVPIWAKSKVQFHVMLTGTAAAAAEWDDEVQGDGVGEMEIERIPTRIVEVRRKDLVPVIERLEKLKKVQGAREVMVPDTVAGVSNDHDQVAGEDGVQDGSGRWAAGLRGMAIRRSSSCSSFGSEGGAAGGSGGGANGFHRGYQDSPAADTPPSSFGSPPYFHQTQQGLAATAAAGRSDGPLVRSMSGGSEVYQDRSMAAAEGGAVATGPPMNIPRAEQRDVLTNFMKPGGRGGGVGGFANSGGSGSGDAEGGSAGEGSSDTHEGRRGTEVGAAGSGDGGTRGLEELAVRENGGKHPGVLSSGNGKSRWDATAIGQASAKGTAKQGPGSATAAGVSDPEFEGAFVMDGCGIHGGEGGVSDSPLDSSPGREDGGGRGEDGESEDTEGGRSKSEENESAEQGDDVWEGSMFPFCEEGHGGSEARKLGSAVWGRDGGDELLVGTPVSGFCGVDYAVDARGVIALWQIARSGGDVLPAWPADGRGQGGAAGGTQHISRPGRRFGPGGKWHPEFAGCAPFLRPRMPVGASYQTTGGTAWSDDTRRLYFKAAEGACVEDRPGASLEGRDSETRRQFQTEEWEMKSEL